MDGPPAVPGNRPAEVQLTAMEREDPELFQELMGFWTARLARAREAAQAEAGIAGIDPYAVEADLLTYEAARAAGTDRPDGRCFVPMADGSGMRFQPSPPTAQGPRVIPLRRGTGGPGAWLAELRGAFHGEGMSVRMGIMLAVLALVICGPIIALTLPSFGDPAQETAAGAQPGGTAVAGAIAATVTTTATTEAASGSWLASAGWAGLPGSAELLVPQTLELVGSNLPPLPVVDGGGPSQTGAWTPALPPHTAVWLPGSLANTVICLGPDLAADLARLKRNDQLTLRTRAGASRRYTVQRTATVPRTAADPVSQTRSGLTLIACGTPGALRQVVVAAYRPDTPAEGPVGQPIGVGDALAVTVTGVRVITPTTTLPPGEIDVAVEVELQNLQRAPQQLNSFSDVLQVGGQLADVADDRPRPDLAPAGQPGSTRTLTYRYRVPTAGGEARWQIQTPRGAAAAVRLTVPAAQPAIRPMLIGAKAEADGPLGLAFRVTNDGAAPVTPDWTALAVVDADGTPLGILERRGLPQTIPPRSTVDAAVVVERPQGAAIVTTGPALGGRRWQLTLPHGGA